MSINELQQRLIDRIKKIDVPEVLEYLDNLLETEGGNEKVYQLSEEQARRIREAQEEYKAGKYTTQEDLDKELDEWMEE